MSKPGVVVVGGGAAGFFAAITCAEALPAHKVLILEKGAQFLGKVKISGGGRCNVTHACFDPVQLSQFYPRGSRALVGPLRRFGPTETVRWFEQRGVKLKREPDGRMFPVTDSSQTIIDCLLEAARAAGVELRNNCGLERAAALPDGGFELGLSRGEDMVCEKLMLATGGCRVPAAGNVAVSLGHTLEPPVPSLFTFHVDLEWLRNLAGISVDRVELAVPGSGLKEHGPMLITHAGVSGPAVLKLSAWGARELHRMNYCFGLRVNWLPELRVEGIEAEIELRRQTQPARMVVNSAVGGLPARLWEQLVLQSGIVRETRWSGLSRSAQHNLVQFLVRSELPVTGKTLNQDEFVTCGGVRLGEVNFKTMESRVRPGLYFGGELLDIDALTGGFNFQAAWTTGWIAGTAIGEALEV
jgi:predicted Rossmann fold flavoprotein